MVTTKVQDWLSWQFQLFINFILKVSTSSLKINPRKIMEVPRNMTQDFNVTDHELYKSSIVASLIVVNILSFLSNMACMMYLIFKLTLNPYIKTMYYIMNFQNILQLMSFLGWRETLVVFDDWTITGCARSRVTKLRPLRDGCQG